MLIGKKLSKISKDNLRNEEITLSIEVTMDVQHHDRVKVINKSRARKVRLSGCKCKNKSKNQ